MLPLLCPKCSWGWVGVAGVLHFLVLKETADWLNGYVNLVSFSETDWVDSGWFCPLELPGSYYGRDSSKISKILSCSWPGLWRGSLGVWDFVWRRADRRTWLFWQWSDKHDSSCWNLRPVNVSIGTRLAPVSTVADVYGTPHRAESGGPWVGLLHSSRAPHPSSHSAHLAASWRFKRAAGLTRPCHYFYEDGWPSWRIGSHHKWARFANKGTGNTRGLVFGPRLVSGLGSLSFGWADTKCHLSFKKKKKTASFNAQFLGQVTRHVSNCAAYGRWLCLVVQGSVGGTVASHFQLPSVPQHVFSVFTCPGSSIFLPQCQHM